MFILGVLFASLILPLLGPFVDLVVSWFEKLHSKNAVYISKNNAEVMKNSKEEEKEKDPIGFMIGEGNNI